MKNFVFVSEIFFFSLKSSIAVNIRLGIPQTQSSSFTVHTTLVLTQDLSKFEVQFISNN
jgi:hypothetical protein